MKTDKEKMLAGLAYKAMGKELLRERQHAKELIFDFNALRPREVGKRNEVIKKLFGKTDKSFFMEPPFRCDYGYNIEIGRDFYCNYNLIILDCAKVTIGDHVMIAPNVSIFTAGHPVDPALRKAGYEHAFPVTIGNNVWIGGQVVINPGVTIGDNTVIGSGSVVTKDIPANSVAVGNPCRVIRQVTERDKEDYKREMGIAEEVMG